MFKGRMAVFAISLLALLFLGFFLFTAVTPSHTVRAVPAGAPIVDTLRDEKDDSCDDGDCSLRDAIRVATAGDTITFSVAGRITLSPAVGLGDLNIREDLTIDGGSVIIVSGGNAVRVFNVEAGNVTFDSLTITNGNVKNLDCGGIPVTCGGAIMLQSHEVSVTVTNSTFSGNSAENGGAIGNFGGTLVVINSTFSRNWAAREGGAIFNRGGIASVNNSTLSGNWSLYGGGISNGDGTLTVNNSTLTGNRAESSGGGISSFAGGSTSTTITNSIVSGNVIQGTTTADDLALYWHPTNSFFSGGYNLIGAIDPNITFTGPGDQIGVNDPQLGSLADNGGDTMTHALLPGSLAIDAGGSCDAVTDQRNITRPQGSACDSGAFESQGFDLVLNGGSPQTTVVNTPFAKPLALTVSSAYDEPVKGGQVTFSAPAIGAGLTFTETVATIGSGGAASLPVTANGTAGSYQAVANATGSSGVGLTFNLTNTLPTYDVFFPIVFNTVLDKQIYFLSRPHLH